MKEKMSITDYNKGYPIFTGLFLVTPVLRGNNMQWKMSKFHVIYHFNPGDPRFPEDVLEGDFGKIKHIGIYEDDDILASRVYVGTMTDKIYRHQYNSPTPLHITWDSGKAAPMQSGHRLQRLFEESIPDDGMTTVNHRDRIDGKDLRVKYHAINHIYRSYLGMEMRKENDGSRELKMEKIFEELEPMGIWHTMRNVDSPDSEDIEITL